MKLSVTKKPFKGKPVGAEIELTDRQARLLTKLGRAQYMTRDMVAAPAQAVQEAAPAAAPAADEHEPQQQAQAFDELDSSGAPWDERMHSGTRSQNTDGTWRKRPGARAADE